MFKRSLFAFFISIFFTISVSNAFVPALVVGLADRIFVQAATELSIGVIAKGFAANDPYVRTTATISRGRFASNLAKSKLGFWSTALALGLTFAGEYTYDPELDQLMVVERPPKASKCFLPQYSNWNCGSEYSAAKVWTQSNKVDTCTINGVTYTSCEEQVIYFSGKWGFASASTYTSECYSTCIGYGQLIAVGDPVKRPATDKEIERDILPSIITNPDFAALASKADLAQLFSGAVIPYNPAVSNPTVQSLVDAYNRGVLQTTKPDAPYYVDPELYKQVVDWAKAAQDAIDNVVSDSELDAANEKIKQPITQAQYDESNLKTETASATSLSTALANISPPLEQLKLDNDFVLDKISSPPEPPSGVGFFKWTLPTGSCSGFSVDMSVGNGKLHTTKQVNEFCPFYDSVAHPLLFWFLNIATFLYLFWLWDRSVSDMAR